MCRFVLSESSSLPVVFLFFNRTRCLIPQNKKSGHAPSAILLQNNACPFLKWAGGKRRMLKTLRQYMPRNYHHYYEPFIGGGALFFAVQPQRGYISDINPDLVTAYKVIQQEVQKLIPLLKEHQQLHSKDYYYKVRSQQGLTHPVERAARTIYLNKTCFNGLWRVNRKGMFNVPVGSYDCPNIYTKENLLACSKVLQNVSVGCQDYTTLSPRHGDFCYFDPPYHPLKKTSFTAYTQGGFTAKDQQNLAAFCKELDRQGVKLLLSNSNTPFIRALYKDTIFKKIVISAPRTVSCNIGGRMPAEELLIANYED